MCAVIGRTDPHWGESVHAVVVIRPGFEASEDTLRDHCRAQIAAYKCPRSFEFRDSLPLTAAGKILKSDLRKELRFLPGSIGIPPARSTINGLCRC